MEQEQRCLGEGGRDAARAGGSGGRLVGWEQHGGHQQGWYRGSIPRWTVRRHYRSGLRAH